MTEYLGYATHPVPEEECVATIHKAIELGCTFLDTSDIYGDGANEALIGEVAPTTRACKWHGSYCSICPEAQHNQVCWNGLQAVGDRQVEAEAHLKSHALSASKSHA
jgi:predicted oxidoreductase